MNTPTTKTSLLSAFCAVLAPLYRNRLADYGYGAEWDNTHEDHRKKAVAALDTTIPQALKQFGDTGFPTKAALRSYLSITPARVETPALYPATLEGFDDLYNELLQLFTLKHIVEDERFLISGEQAKEIAELRKQLADREKTFGTQQERYLAETIKLRHDFQSAANSHERESESLRQRNTTLTVRCDALQAKVDELAKLPHKEHWDDVAYGATILFVENSDTLDKLAKSNAQINDLNHTIGVLTNDRNQSAERVTYVESLNTSLHQRIAGLTNELNSSRVAVAAGNSDNETLRKQAVVNTETIATLNQRLTRLRGLSDTVSATLKEFKIESPTNSIPDMVRAACEKARYEREICNNTAKHGTEIEGAYKMAKAELAIREQLITDLQKQLKESIVARSEMIPVSRNVKVTTTKLSEMGSLSTTREEFTHFEPADIDETSYQDCEIVGDHPGPCPCNPYRPGQIHPSTVAKIKDACDTTGSLSSYAMTDPDLVWPTPSYVTNRLTGFATAITLLGTTLGMCYLAVKYLGHVQ